MLVTFFTGNNCRHQYYMVRVSITSYISMLVWVEVLCYVGIWGHLQGDSIQSYNVLVGHAFNAQQHQTYDRLPARVGLARRASRCDVLTRQRLVWEKGGREGGGSLCHQHRLLIHFVYPRNCDLKWDYPVEWPHSVARPLTNTRSYVQQERQ